MEAISLPTIFPPMPVPHLPLQSPLCLCPSYHPTSIMRQKRLFPSCVDASTVQRRDSLPLPHVQTRNTKSLTLIESECAQQMSTNLAAKALNWLFSISSNSRVQSIVLRLTDVIKGDATTAAKYSNQNTLITPSQLSAAQRGKTQL